MKIVIKGLKKAVGDYNRINVGGYSANYGYMMLNRTTGELWVDEFCDYGHNSYKVYDNPAIINIVRKMASDAGEFNEVIVNMANVKAAAERYCKAWQEKQRLLVTMM